MRRNATVHIPTRPHTSAHTPTHAQQPSSGMPPSSSVTRHPSQRFSHTICPTDVTRTASARLSWTRSCHSYRFCHRKSSICRSFHLYFGGYFATHCSVRGHPGAIQSQGGCQCVVASADCIPYDYMPITHIQDSVLQLRLGWAFQ